MLLLGITLHLLCWAPAVCPSIRQPRLDVPAAAQQRLPQCRVLAGTPLGTAAPASARGAIGGWLLRGGWQLLLLQVAAPGYLVHLLKLLQRFAQAAGQGTQRTVSIAMRWFA